MKKYCVISAVGKQSLHREWIKESYNFDLHLIVYDDSFDKYCNDSPFVTHSKGYKLKLVYDYFNENRTYLDKYEYFFIPDDDIQIDAYNIGLLFKYMSDYNLEISQPALSDSYYSFEHTLKNKFYKLRYTNFVEIMVPCFSQDALKKVMFTFNENKSGWGIEGHWPELIGFSGKEIAIIDDIEAVHTRPVQSFSYQNMKEKNEYIEKYKLSREIKEYDGLPNIDYKPDENKEWKPIITDDVTYRVFEKQLEIIISALLDNFDSMEDPGLLGGKTGMSLFILNYYKLSGKRKFLDCALTIIELVSDNLGVLKDNTNFSSGLSGISWYVEYLAQHGYIENDTDEVLEEICLVLYEQNFRMPQQTSVNEGIINYGLHLQARMSNPNFSQEKELNFKEINMNNIIICSLDDFLDRLKHKNCIHKQNECEISEIILFLYKALKINAQNKTLIQILNGYISCFYNYLVKKEAATANTKAEAITILNCELQNAYALFKAAKILQDKEKEKFSINMVLETITQKNTENCDAGILYASMSIAHLYNHFYQQTSIEAFKTASLFWIDFTFNQKTIQSEVNPGLLGGLTGVGLVLISAMADFKPDWDSCLLL